MDYRKIFLPPVYDSLERSQKAVFLHYTLILSTVALLIFGYLNLTWGAMTLGWMLLVISGLCIVGVVLNKTKHFYLAAIGFTVIIFIAIFYNLIDGAALHDPGIAALPIFLILVNILFSRSFIPYFTLASILGIFAVYYFWKTGLLVLSQAPTLNRVIVLTILQVVTGFLSWMIVSTQRDTSEELDSSEERFQALFMAAPIGIGVTTLDGKVLVYNESLIKMSGYTPDEFILLNVRDYYANSEDRIKMLDILKSAGVVRGYETQLLRKDKSVFNVIMSVIPLKYGDEDGLLTIIEDVTERKRTELERQEELEFRRLLLDSSPIFFTVVNEQGKTTMMNKSMLGALGYEWEEVQGEEYIALFVPEREKLSVLKVIEESFEQGKTTFSENHILTKTGQELLVEWHACPIINPEGKIDFIFAYGVDITDRKIVENALKESAERHRVFFEESPLLNWQFNLNPPMPIDLPSEKQIDWILHKTRLSEVNEGFIQSLRGPLEIHMETTLYENWGGKEDYGKVTIREFIEQGYSLNMYETLENTVQGDLAWSIINCFGVIENNHLIRIWGTTMDITDRKNAEQALQESHQLLATAETVAKMGSWRWDLDTNHVSYSDNALQLYGLSPDEYDGNMESVFTVFHPDDREIVQEEIQSMLTEKEPRQFEYRVLGPDGGYKVIEGTNKMYSDKAGNITHLIGHIQDITERKQTAEKLQKSEEKFQKVFMASPYSLIITRIEDDVIIDVNEGFEKNIGLSREETIGHTAIELGLMKNPADIGKLSQIITETGAVEDFEVTAIMKDGQERIVLLRGAIIELKGEPHRIIAVEDITDRKKAEEELRESDTRNRLLLQSLPMAFYRAHPSDQYGGTWISEQIDQIVGFSPEEMVDPDFWSSRLHPEDRQMALRAFDGLEETKTLEIEYRWQRFDGEYIWVQDSAVLVADDEGNPQEIIGTWIDVSDRKKSEQTIRDSEARYRTLFESASDAIFILREGRVIECNSSIENMFGYTKGEIIGKLPGEISPPLQPDGQESVLKAETLNRKLKEGSSQLFEWVHQKKDGSEFTAEVKLHQISIQDETLSLAVLRDITERKNAEEAAQEERQRLARDLHDAVSQTLWSASLIADVLPDVWEQDPAQGLERLERLRQLNRGALAEMRTLLLELRPIALIETNLTELLNQLIEATTSRSGTQISTDIEGDYDLPEDVHVAFYRIAQEALNNATRHALASDIVVRLNCGPKDVRLEIEDNGRGFDTEDTSPGQHLGLNIMRERAFSIGATLDIISRSDEGTQVILIWTQDREVNDG